MNAPLPRHAARPASSTVFAPPLRGHRPRTPRPARRRRRGQRDADRATHNHATERWMVSYADFITLLFAFFVVMYATSQVNEGRYHDLKGALAVAFTPSDATPQAAAPAATVAQADTAPPAAAASVTPQPAPSPTDPAAPSTPLPADPATPSSDPASPPTPVDPTEKAEIEKNAERTEHMKQLATRVDEHLQTLVEDGQVQVTRGARGIAIEINAAVLFDPANADLKPASHEALRALAKTLSKVVEPLQIEGHSDDAPIATKAFRSNWELSAARAASVARFLIDAGVAPNRIGVAGYAEYRPLTANADAASRARNRRVTIVVLSADDARPKEGPAAGETSQH